MKAPKNQFIIKALIGVVFIIIGAILLQMPTVEKTLAITLLNAGIIVVVFSLFYHFRYKGKVINDERTRKIGAKSLAYSWMGTFVLIGVLSWLDELKLVTLPSQTLLGLMMFFMAVTGSGLQIYLNYRGDGE